MLSVPFAAGAEESPPCVEDEALGDAAADLLVTGEPLNASKLERAAAEAGSDAIRLFALTTAQDARGDARLAHWLGSLRERADAPLACGEARSNERRLVIATFRAGSIELVGREPIQVRGTLANGFSEPRLIIETDERDSETIPLDADALSRGVEIPLEIAHPTQVQLVARGPHGVRPVAQRNLSSFESSVAEEPASASDTTLAHRIADLRRSRGSSPLRAHRILAREAQRHADRMCAEHEAAHVIGPEGDPQERVRRAGMRARVVGETVARAEDVGSAWTALVRSPSHFAALTDRRFTDAGIGHARDDRGNVCVAVLLAAWPRLIR